MRKFMIAAAALALAPAAAQAVSYDLTTNFGASVFRYGAGNYGLASPNFTEFTTEFTNCFGQTGFVCETAGPAGTTPGISNLPGVGVDADHNDDVQFITVNVPRDRVWSHPADGAGATDAVIQFIAPIGKIYSLVGAFSRLDTSTVGPGGNGVLVGIYKTTAAGVTTSLFGSAALALPGTLQFAATGYNLSTTLAAGDTISYVVNNNGSFGADSTGIAGTITSVPEPASWAMMVGGFGLLGAGLRASRRKAAFA